MAKSKPEGEQPKPRGVRFPEDLRLQLVELAKSSDRTFSDMVIHAVRKGLAVLEQEERDRAEGERMRQSKTRNK